EMIYASGLTLIANELSPIKASTYGVGDIIIDAMDRDVKEFIIGIGGSATNDVGIGMLTRLGVKFLDENNEPVHPSAHGIKDLKHIDVSSIDPRIKECKFSIACDVTNPLVGKNGSAYIFGPQKGADEKQVEELNSLHIVFHEKTKEIMKDADCDYPGSG